jgi:glyoxalase family protein
MALGTLMSQTTQGLHHVTAIAGDAQQNLAFYSGLLGLRLFKRTVNFDDPGNYHLYYGNEQGQPGTIMTFFPWKGAPRGSLGAGQTSTTAFSVPEGSLGFWEGRFRSAGLPVESPESRFDEEVLSFADLDGLRLELVAQAGVEDLPQWQEGPVAARYAIRSFHGVTLLERSLESTAELLTSSLGFKGRGSQGRRHRFVVPGGGPASRVDILVQPEAGFGRIAVGSVHHVAFRIAGDDEQIRWREESLAKGLRVTPVQDRNYFHSVYFREPGGVLFELATDPPGFTVDESVSELGTSLRLPDWLESEREDLEARLPPLELPPVEPVAS